MQNYVASLSVTRVHHRHVAPLKKRYVEAILLTTSYTLRLPR